MVNSAITEYNGAGISDSDEAITSTLVAEFRNVDEGESDLLNLGNSFSYYMCFTYKSYNYLQLEPSLIWPLVLKVSLRKSVPGCPNLLVITLFYYFLLKITMGILLVIACNYVLNLTELVEVIC